LRVVDAATRRVTGSLDLAEGGRYAPTELFLAGDRALVLTTGGQALGPGPDPVGTVPGPRPGPTRARAGPPPGPADARARPRCHDCGPGRPGGRTAAARPAEVRRQLPGRPDGRLHRPAGGHLDAAAGLPVRPAGGHR